MYSMHISHIGVFGGGGGAVHLGSAAEGPEGFSQGGLSVQDE